MQRQNGRPSFICHEASVERTRAFIAQSGVDAPFTFQVVPFRNHNDEWALRPSPARDALRAWLDGVLRAPVGRSEGRHTGRPSVRTGRRATSPFKRIASVAWNRHYPSPASEKGDLWQQNGMG
jgi:hypothetical protein